MRACFTPSPGGGLLDGSTLERAAAVLADAGAGIVGVNCGAGPASLLDPARRLAELRLAPVMAAPGAGLPTFEAGRARYALTPDAFAKAAIQFREAGVSFFAGCCGTSPEHLCAAVRACGAPAE